MALSRKTPLKRGASQLKRTPMKPGTKGLKTTTPLQRGTSQMKRSAMRSTPAKDRPIKIGKVLVKSVSALKKEADKFFSQYVRYRDGRYTHAGEWETQCITCNRWLPLKQMQAGHFVTRAINDLRFDEENVNGQCLKCNVFGAGEQFKYSVAVDVKYGEGTATALMSRRTLIHKFTREELQQIITDAKTCIAHYKKQEEANVVNNKSQPEPSKAKKEAKKPLNTAITNAGEPANKKYRRRTITVVQK